ncbi:hypothetical protein N0V84_004894 [Fusarium piperis]|uniref:Uncharacterized protein n=1 Tax=Fusarium piperis TaxID=1435070 RepID=A0A9W8WEQ5_9HYPO|nr:hypothetical protein N0V84_004894 [Fusarium piperis]
MPADVPSYRMDVLAWEAFAEEEKTATRRHLPLPDKPGGTGDEVEKYREVIRELKPSHSRESESASQIKFLVLTEV